MQQIEVRDAISDLKIFINGVPNLSLIPKSLFESFISVLEIQICDYLNKNLPDCKF